MQSTAALRRNHILTNAGEVFSRMGYKAASLELIAQESQLSVTSIKGYYDNKQAVLLDIYSELCKCIADILATPVAGADLVEFCTYIVDSLVNLMDQRMDMAWTLFVENPACMKKAREKASAALIEATCELVRRLVTLDYIRVEDPQATAMLCYGNMSFGIMQWISGGWDIDRKKLCVQMLLFNIRALGCELNHKDAEQMVLTYENIR